MDIGTCAGDGVFVDELESSFGKYACVKDIEEPYISGEEDNSDAEEEGSEELKTEPGRKCLENRANFPCSGMLAADEEDAEPETALKSQFSPEPSTLATCLPLVSAMKGSRQKQGASPRKLTVTWAPDVHDPIPNLLSHTVTTKQKKSRKDRDREKHNSNHHKKNGKSGQKGNSSRGDGKDKKQFRKLAGRSDKYNRTMDAMITTMFLL